MPFGSEFTEKLTHTLAATALCCGTAAVTASHNAELLGLVEAVLGTAAVGHYLWRRLASRPDNLLVRCARSVAQGADALIATEFRGDPDAAVLRAQAETAIAAALPEVAIVISRDATLPGDAPTWTEA